MVSEGIPMRDTERAILKNQVAIMSALNKLMCRTRYADISDATVINELSDRYNYTKYLLGEEYVERW